MYIVYHSSFPKIYKPSQKNVYYAPLLIKKWKLASYIKL